ncbi:S8 family peptidase [Paenibacillus puerhi]|uniref:S8 family peptidase n=1 Tax=Paenibacillus puerhi TaxID=2692622 RepID=UPI0013579ABF|nr:S8 family peptidase [Paenibacillus puerhi]
MNVQAGHPSSVRKLNASLKKRLGHPSFHARKRVPVIIRFHRRIEKKRLRALHEYVFPHKIAVRHRLHLLQAVSARVSRACLRRICGCREVRRVYLDGVKKTSLSVATPAIGAAAVRSRLGLTGKGIRIAILDTGVFPHPDLTRPVNRIVAFKDFVRNKKRPYDDNGHGTHVAGDAAGNGQASRGTYRGPAPEVGIVAVKVLGKTGTGNDSTIIKGIEWCVRNRKRLGLRILTLSLGGRASSRWQDDPLCLSVENAVKAGLVVSVAAGNSGPRKKTIESPGITPSALTIGAADDRRTVTQKDDVIAWYSSRGPTGSGAKKPDLAAPGETITSLRAPGSALDKQYPHLRVGKAYFTLSGTSMSAPLAAGAAAQLLQRKPTLSPDQVKRLLKREAFRIKEGANAAGSGEINLRFLIPSKKPARRRAVGRRGRSYRKR